MARNVVVDPRGFLTGIVRIEACLSTKDPETTVAESSKLDCRREQVASHRALNSQRLTSYASLGSRRLVSPKFYAIHRGLVPGIYYSWNYCKDFDLGRSMIRVSQKVVFPTKLHSSFYLVWST